ncbi:MAG TPA: T9SS type A sorting domain-containing protein [Bacteroidales bacterium]|nr:T9SS type A sorting domain-containing protein [Bacteroidales bacterium]HSA43366.1 T9SS type A sorting domain-containing protein [Bacteroidales bacterium]
MKKKLTTALCAFLLFQLAYAQNSSLIQLPLVWLQPDVQNADSVFLRDLTQNSHHAFPLNQAAQPSGSLLNFNPCFLMTDGVSPFLSHPGMGTTGKMTMMAVFQALDTLEESLIWEIKKDTTFYQHLTTQRIQGSSLKFKYRNDNDTTSLVNTFMFAVKDSNTDSIPYDFYVGGNDSTGFTGKIAEFILFNDYLKENDLQKYQSYLCIKYGTTLRKSNYVSAFGDTIWNRKQNQAYSIGVFGLGRDTIFGLNQKQSFSTSIQDIITLGAGSIASSNDQNNFSLNQGDYLLCGSNGEPTTIAWQDTLQTAGVLQRQWLMQASGNTSTSVSTSLQVNLSGIITDSMLCFLVVSPDAQSIQTYSDLLYFLPDSVTPDNVACFSNLNWDTDHSGRDVFSFYFIQEPPVFANHPSPTLPLVQRDDTTVFPHSNPNSTQTGLPAPQAPVHPLVNSPSANTPNTASTFFLFPNPTQGSFDLVVIPARASSMSLRILDSNGGLIQSFDTYNQQQYNYKGTIQVAGRYFLDIHLEGEQKVIQLIVK